MWDTRIEIAGRGPSPGMASGGENLGRAQLRAAELGFRQLLRRKRFPAGFIALHTDELLAQARLEYTRYIASGGEVRSTAGWIIHCAWRRTQNLLEHESRAPGAVSIEDGAGLESEAPTPEEETMEAARHAKVRAAVEALGTEERKVIALTYFEGMSVREASQVLGWDHCKGDRRHHSALARLHQLIGVKEAEQLQVEIGDAAWSLLATGGLGRAGVPAFLHGAAEASARAAAELAGRAHELIRRVLPGGAVDGGVGALGARSAEMGGGGILAAATAGVCGAAAVTCLATGVLGPGVGGIGLGHPAAPERASAPQPITRAAEPVPSAGTTGSGARPPAVTAEPRRHELRGRAAKLTGAKRRESSKRAASEPASAPVAPPAEVAEEFDPYPEGGESSESQSTPEAARTRPTGSGGGSGPPPQATGKEVEAEFAY